jgi:predicted nuclease of predicted toxin-antitoxin system
VRPVKLLIDENLSPAVALKLAGEGHDVVHVRDRGLLAGTDAEVFALAYREDRVVVTSNVADFLALAASTAVHAGTVLVEDGAVLRDEQELLLRRVLHALHGEHEAGRDMINRVLYVDLAGKVEFADRSGV